MDTKCTAGAHIETLKKKFAQRIWILRHLKRAKLDNAKLVRVYSSFIRPCFEYLCATFTNMLIATQSKALECMQAIALKTIFGWNYTYAQCLEMANIETLERRRKDLCLNFAKKTEANERFRHWFPLTEEPPYDHTT